MALATDQIIKKATTQTTNLTAIIPKLWAPQLEAILKRKSVIQQSLLQNTDLMVPNSGDEIYLPALPYVAQADALTEGTDMTPIALSNAVSLSLVPTEYGKAIEITRKAMDRVKYDIMTEILDRLAYSMNMRLENNAAALYSATAATDLGNTNSIFGGPSITTIRNLYPNGHTNANVVATDTLSAATLRKAKGMMAQLENMPFEDGFFHLYLTPDSYDMLLSDPQVRDDLHFAAPGESLNNEVGQLYGIRLIISNYIPVVGEGASNAVNVNKNLLVSPRWAAVAWKRKPALVVDPTLYDFGRRRRFGITADFDMKLLHADRALILNSAKQY